MQLEEPSSPESPPACTTPRYPNDGILDDFLPNDGDVLDTGSTVNTCPNSVDGSTAVVWEFRSFTIPAGVTVNIVGVNPAIILVSGPVIIQGAAS